MIQKKWLTALWLHAHQAVALRSRVPNKEIFIIFNFHDVFQWNHKLNKIILEHIFFRKTGKWKTESKIKLFNCILESSNMKAEGRFIAANNITLPMLHYTPKYNFLLSSSEKISSHIWLGKFIKVIKLVTVGKTHICIEMSQKLNWCFFEIINLMSWGL